MDTRLEIAAMIVANGPCRVEKALEIADALIAAHEATAKPALPEDAPVMEWRVAVEAWRSKRWVCAEYVGNNDEAQMVIPSIVSPAGASAFRDDVPAVLAAATAYSAAKGFRAVFTGEGAAHDR